MPHISILWGVSINMNFRSNEMSAIIKKLLADDKFRYLIAGGCTTLVNLITFFVLRTFTDIPRNTCNAIAILCAILFAYVISKLFVFKTRTGNISKTIGEFLTFISVRIVSMGIEILGFAILCDSFRIKEVYSKFFVQFVVIIVNYLFSKLIVFKKERKTFAEFIKANYIYMVPFGIVVAFLLGICISLKVTPFGPKSLTIVDSLHQYLPFYAEYRDKLLHEGSLLYTWNLALGSNFVSLSSYYLSSPFNYIFLLLPKTQIPAGVTIIAILKIALSGTTMSYYLANKDGHPSKNIGIIGLSVAYALSNFVIGYGWNFMWLDCLMIFPLIILGFDRLMKTGNPKMYVLSLFYCLYCNYYIGFMVCIFLVLWFFTYRHKGIKKFFVDGIRFAISSLLAGGLSAFLLYPAYKGIMTTASAGTKVPGFKWYGSVYELMKQQFILTKPITTQTFDGGVNLYCGTFVIVAVFLYVFCSKIRFFDKLGKLALLVFLMVSFDNMKLNFIWHGMHDQYGIPNRFSFLFMFVIITMAYDVLRRVNKMHPAYILSGGMLADAYVLMVDMRIKTEMTRLTFILTLSLIVVYVALMCMRSLKACGHVAFGIAFAVICSGEILYNAAEGYGNNGVASLDAYKTTNQVTAANNRIKEIAEEEDVVFYRSELMKSKVLDEVTWHHMPSVGTFCSTVLGDVTTTMGRLGFYTGANEFLYMGSTPFTNTLFDVRYLLQRPGDLNYYPYDYVETVDGIGIYENPYPSSIGYAVSDNVKSWERDSGLPVNVQNTLAFAMTGEPAFFSAVYPEYNIYSGNSDARVSGNLIAFTPNQAGDVQLSVSYFAPMPGDYYINIRGNYVYKTRIFINGEEIGYDRYQGQLFHLGELNADDYVTIEYNYRNTTVKEYSASLYSYVFKEGVYQMTYDKLTENMLDVDEFDDGYIHGSIYMPEGQTLFTTVPYDKGWKVKVDGKEVEYYKVAGAFIGVDMPVGEHEIEMIYTPVGLYKGIAISVVSLILFVLYVVCATEQKKRVKLVKNTNNEIDQEINI